MEKKGVAKPDILHHLLLLINCHFLLEKTKLKPVFVSLSLLRHHLLSVKNVTARQGFSLEVSKRLDLMKYIFVFLSLKKIIFLHFTFKRFLFSESTDI